MGVHQDSLMVAVFRTATQRTIVPRAKKSMGTVTAHSHCGSPHLLRSKAVRSAVTSPVHCPGSCSSGQAKRQEAKAPYHRAVPELDTIVTYTTRTGRRLPRQPRRRHRRSGKRRPRGGATTSAAAAARRTATHSTSFRSRRSRRRGGARTPARQRRHARPTTTTRRTMGEQPC